VIHRVNPAAERILDQTEVSLNGRSVADALGQSMPILVGHLLEAVAEGRATDRAEVNVERSDGSSIPLGLSISQQVDEQGEGQGVIAVFQDLTSVVKMRDRMRANDRLAAMGELSASIAHEIRNPLASIRGSVEMLSGELHLDGENQRLMELVLKESARLNRILSDFLAYARLKPVHRANRHLGDLLEGLRQLVESRDDVGGAMKVEVVPADLDLIVEVDEELMTQVFLNIAINALDAMEGKGTLRVQTNLRPDERPALVTVRFLDEGPGIEAEAMPRLFEPFFTTKSQGTGLGLPLASRIVSNHDGTIEARNLDGGGAEFLITLPVIGIWRDGNLDRNPGAIREFTVGVA
jgi:two-component system sensor histidine kinase PilS (NtrC family)